MQYIKFSNVIRCGALKSKNLAEHFIGTTNLIGEGGGGGAMPPCKWPAPLGVVTGHLHKRENWVFNSMQTFSI